MGDQLNYFKMEKKRKKRIRVLTRKEFIRRMFGRNIPYNSLSVVDKRIVKRMLKAWNKDVRAGRLK